MKVEYEKSIIPAYLLCGVLVLGHAINNLEHFGPRDKDDSPARVYVATISALLWPLYVSVKLFEKRVEP